MKKIVSFVCFLFLIACQNNNNVEVTRTQYFNLEEFLDTLASDLTHKQVNKRIVLNGAPEDSTISLNREEWKKELAMIGKLNIDKPSWYGFYDIDTAHRKGVKTISYKTDAKNIPIKDLEVQYENQKPSVVQASLQRSNFFSNFERSILIKKNAITIINSENLIVVGENKVEIYYTW